MSRVTILTLGTRGDVQPYVALGKGLQAAGHQVTIGTANDFAQFVCQNGLQHTPISDDMRKLTEDPEAAKAMVGGGNKLKLMKMVMPMLRKMLDECWRAAQGADVILYHPKTMGGLDIGERLGIPAILAFALPGMTPTSTMANPLLTTRNLGGWLNRLSYQAMLFALTAPYRKMINRWRSETLGLSSNKSVRLVTPTTPTLYAYSQHVVPRPIDWPATTLVTGYWFLDQLSTWQPPADLARFLVAGSPPVYIGFGSMRSVDEQKTTRMIVDSIKQAGVRAIVATGWGALAQDVASQELFVLESAPHDWLFPRCAAVVHHGGAGTTAAGLRAGKPTLICPFFGDQPFWGSRVAALGVGPKPIPQKQLTAETLAHAIRETVTNPTIQSRTAELGAKIRSEDGIAVAVEAIEKLL